MPTRKNDRNPHFGINVRQLRILRALSQDELAKALQIPSEHGGVIVSGWERGEREPSLAMVCKIADYFGVSCDFLLGRKPGKPFSDKTYSLLAVAEDEISEDNKKRLFEIIKVFAD